ncbi:MAG: response regulator [Chitinophagaceae bacterium]|nr:response regulator [Chitinophagaceae bacterium]
MQATVKQITKVLLIDDDREEFYILQTAIHDISPAITVSHSGVLVDDFAKSDIHTYDLIFLDINMPPTDGFEWLLKIRKLGCSVPVVMYSTTMNQNRINKAYQAGAHLFLPKPNNFADLIQSLTRIFQLNWLNPEEVKQQFFRNGNYLPFVRENSESDFPGLFSENILPEAC